MNIEFEKVDEKTVENLTGQALEDFIKKEMEKFDEKIKYCEENHGAVEVRDTIMDKADFFMKIKDPVTAKKIYLEAYEKTIGVSKRLEVLMQIILIAYQASDVSEMKLYIEKCVVLLEEGGDWERKNKLKVYQGVYYIMVRDFKNAALKLLDCMSTFNSPEVVDFETCVFYTVLSSMMTLERSDIKTKVMKNSEVLSCIKENNALNTFLNSYYTCDYAGFFRVLVDIVKQVEDSKILSSHRKFIIKELRIMIYTQFLESYKSVTLECMAEAFGVSQIFLDKELSEFISARRLHCKIDKVRNLIEYEKIDHRTTDYKRAIREGEVILNRIQRLSRVIDV